MFEWLVNSGDRPKLDPPVGTGSSDQDDDLHDQHVSLGQIRSRRRRVVQRSKIDINPTHSSTGISEMGSDDDDHSSNPTPGGFHFDEDDATNAYELEACGSMLFEAVSMNPNNRESSTRVKSQPWKHLPLESKSSIEPEGTSPRKKLLKRMKGVVEVATKIDPLPSEPPTPRCDFDDEVLEEAMKMATKNHSLKHHSNLQRLLHESDSSDVPSSVGRARRTRSSSPQSRGASRKPRDAAAESLGKQKKYQEDYIIDSDNSILKSRTGSDVDSSDASLFQTLQRAMQVQRAGRPSPPASPLPQPRHDQRPGQVYAAVQSTLDCEFHDDLILKSRTPRSHPYRASPTPERLRIPLSNPQERRRQQEISPTQRKRRSRRRQQGFRSMSAGSGSTSDDNDKYATSWRKKRRVVSPTHSNAAHTISTQRRSNITAPKCTLRHHPNSMGSPSDANEGLRKQGPAKSPRKSEECDHTSTSTMPDFLLPKCPNLIVPGKKFLTSMQPMPRRNLVKKVSAPTRGDQAIHSRYLKSRQARGVESVDLGHDSTVEEPSKADIQARRRTGLRKPSLADDSSTFVTTDEEGHQSRENRGWARSRTFAAVTRTTSDGDGNRCDAPVLELSSQCWRTRSPHVPPGQVLQSLSGKASEDFDVPSPVQSVDELEVDMISLLSGDCGGHAEGRASTNLRGRAVPRQGESDEHLNETSGVSRWSAFQQANRSDRVSDCIQDESRMSPLLVPQRRKPFRPPKPEKRKSRDCDPDPNVLGLSRLHQSAVATSAYLGDCDVLSVFGGEVQPFRAPTSEENIATTHSALDRVQKKLPPLPERLGYDPSRTDTLSVATRKASESSEDGFQSPKIAHLRSKPDKLQAPQPKPLDEDNAFKTAANISIPIAPGTIENPIVIGDQVISLKAKYLKNSTTDGVNTPYCLLPASEDCACFAHPREAPISHPVLAGSRQNPIIITDANDAIHATRRFEKPILKSSVEVNRTQNIGSQHQSHRLEKADNDGGSDRENNQLTGNAGLARKGGPAEVDAGCSDTTSILTRYHPADASVVCGNHSLAGQGRGIRSPSALDLEDHKECNPLEKMTIRGNNPTLRHSLGDCTSHDCGLHLDMLDYAGAHTGVNTTGHQPNGESAMQILESELERQLGSPNGVLLFKPNISIFTGATERSKEHSDQTCGGGAASASTAIKESLDKVSLTIAKLEKKAREVDIVLSNALDQVHRSVPMPPKALDVDDDDGMTAEIDRLSRCEEELRTELNATQNGDNVREARPAEATHLHNGAKRCSSGSETVVATSESPPLYNVQSISTLHAMDKNGFSALFPVDLTRVDDVQSGRSHESSSRLTEAIGRTASIDNREERRDYFYDAIPPLRRLRDQERTSRKRMKTRISSILNFVDPDSGETIVELTSSCDHEIGSGVVVLHHQNHNDVEIMRLPEQGESQLEDSTEEIEVIFVEESFLSTDSFSFGETKGVYFDWKRSAEDEVELRDDDHAMQANRSEPACAQRDRKKAMISREGHQFEVDKRSKRWTEKAVRDMTVGLPGVLGETRTDRTCGGCVQLGIIDGPIRYSTANETFSQRATSDPPGGGFRASHTPEVVSPKPMARQFPTNASEVEIELPGVRSGGLSDVFSGIDDSVRYHSRAAVEGQKVMEESTEDNIKRRVEEIMRRSERSQRNGVRILEATPMSSARPDAPSQTSSSMMVDEEDERSLSLTLSISTKGSVTSNTSLASVASADAEEKLRALISRGKALVSSEQSKGAHLPHQTTQPRDQGDAPAKVRGNEVAAGAMTDDDSRGEVSEWGTSRSALAKEEDCVKSQPVELFAEIKHKRIPKAACQLLGKPPPGICPSSRRLARLRRLQNNWIISANGYVVPKQGASSANVTEVKPAQKGRYRCAQKRFARVNTQSHACDESCSTLTPSVRRQPDKVERYMPAIRMSSMLARETNSTAPTPSPNLRQNGTQAPTTVKKGDVPAKKKSILGQLHLSKLLSKAKRDAAVKSTPIPTNEMGLPIGPLKASPASRLFQMTRKTTPRVSGRSISPGIGKAFETCGRAIASSPGVVAARPGPTIPNNPFDNQLDSRHAFFDFEDKVSLHMPVETSNTLSPTKRRLHLSRMPDFPDLLHPSLRNVLSYPPMSDATYSTTQIVSVKSASPRSLKGMLPSHVRARNLTSALPGSLLWEATHGSATDE